MAEDNSGGGEKEFEATEQRRREARRDGDVPQSKETNTFALVAGMIVAALVFSAATAGSVFDAFSSMFYHADSYADDIFSSGGARSKQWLANVLLGFLPVFLVVAVIVLGALIVQQAIAFSTKKIKPDAKKLSPAENLKKKYGPKGLLDFLKDTAKLMFAGAIASGSMSNLKWLNLSSQSVVNYGQSEIYDAGMSALAGALANGSLPALKKSSVGKGKWGGEDWEYHPQVVAACKRRRIKIDD